MTSNTLLELLLQINSIIDQNEMENAPKLLTKVICEALEADFCGLFLQSHNGKGFSFMEDYSFQQGNNFPAYWDKYDCRLLTKPEYFSKPNELNFLSDISWQSCLVLPLKLKHQNIGFAIVGWNDTAYYNDMSFQDVQLLEIIAKQLTDTYYTYPHLTKLIQTEKDLAALFLKAEQDLETNRKQVALELHDEVGQVLTSILLQLRLLQQSNDIEYVKGRLGGLHQITLETLEEVRRISKNLRPLILEKLGLQAAVEAHIKEFIATTGIEVELRTNNLDVKIPELLQNIIYRAVQEGLTNIIRHSGANRVMVSMTIKGNNLFLQIVDNGKGLEEKAEFDMGLLGMRERTVRAQGKFWLINKIGQGLTINILLPLN